MISGQVETVKIITNSEWQNLSEVELAGLANFGGMILYDKPGGITSHDVVYQVRKRLTQVCGKKVKVGHAGTLDPLATGLLLVLVGPAVKDQSRLQDLDKVYECVSWMGIGSDTYDVDGKCWLVEPVEWGELESAKAKFSGKFVQVVPAFSAVKMGGRKLYELARDGKVDLKKLPGRQVEVFEFEVREYRILNKELCKMVTGLNSKEIWEVNLKFKVSSGTYIRSLVHDWGMAVGSDGVVYKLRRVKV